MQETARARLKSAIAKAADLSAQIEKMEAATERAEAAAQEAQTELAKYAGLDKTITAWRIDQVKKEASTKVLPEKLKAKLEAKRAAEDELEQAEGTLEAISEELEALRTQEKPLEGEKDNAAVSVLLEYADGLARELADHNARGRELRQSLNGLTRAIAKSTTTIQAALNNYDFEFLPGCDLEYDCGQRWKKRLEAILADPDAVVTTPKIIVPSDYSFKVDKWQGPGYPHPQATTLLRPED